MSEFKAAGAVPDGSAEDLAVRDAVLAIAEAFAAHEIDHWQVRRECNGPDRYTAVRYTERDHPSRRHLLAMLDELIATDATAREGWLYQTEQGVFSLSEIEAVGGVIQPHGAGQVIRFPVRYGLSGPEFRATA